MHGNPKRRLDSSFFFSLSRRTFLSIPFFYSTPPAAFLLFFYFIDFVDAHVSFSLVAGDSDHGFCRYPYRNMMLLPFKKISQFVAVLMVFSQALLLIPHMCKRIDGVEVVNADVLVTLVSPRQQQLRSTDPLAPSSMWSSPCSVSSNDIAQPPSSTVIRKRHKGD